MLTKEASGPIRDVWVAPVVKAGWITSILPIPVRVLVNDKDIQSLSSSCLHPGDVVKLEFDFRLCMAPCIHTTE